MFGVGRLGSYISRGVFTVSGPFHPFGGAVDIVVVEQPDGTFKSSPWYIRFGKFQGVLKASEKVVTINVNGDDAGFHMYLDHKGEAYFVREVDTVQEEVESYPSSGDETDVQDEIWRSPKSKSCNFDARRIDLVSELDKAKLLARTNSRPGRTFGLSFGRRSMKENGFQGGQSEAEVDSVSPLQRAEIAADLMDVMWTTNIRGGASQVSPSKSASSEVVSNVTVEDGLNEEGSLVNNSDETMVDCSVSDDGIEKTNAEVRSSTKPANYMEIYTLEETYMRVDLSSGTSHISTETDAGIIDEQKDAQGNSSEVSKSTANLSQTADNEETEASVSGGEDHSNARSSFQDESFTATDRGAEKAVPSVSCDSGGDNSLCNIVNAHLEGEAGIPSLCNTTEGLLEDLNSKGRVSDLSSSTVFNMEKSTSVEPCNSLNGSINKCFSDDVSAAVSDFHSPCLAPERECSPADMDKQPLNVGAKENSEDSTQDINNAAPLDNSDEEQFSFSDLDHPKVDKHGQIETSSPDGNECLPRDSLSSEDEVTGTYVSDNKSHQFALQGDLLTNHLSPKVNSNRVSSPISILKLDTDAGEQVLAPVADSLPNLPVTGDDLDSYGAPQLVSRSLDSNLEAIKIVNDVLVTSELDGVQQQVENMRLKSDSSHTSDEIKKIISDPAVEISLCRHLLSEGMGYEAAALAFDAEKLDVHKLSSLGADIVKDEKLVVRIGGLYFPWDAALPIVSAIGSPRSEQILEPKGMIAVGHADNKTSEDVAQKSNSKSGSWKLWPFSSKRSNNMQPKMLDSETATESPIEEVVKTDVVGEKAKKKKIRVKVPTSEQLATLNLNDGKNVVTFTFTTAMLGKQQVDARIFLWKWDTRVVISDVDGTITKSDVLGQFMPLMGIDWSQTGVTHLFSAIKENGYQVLFLSARSISQAYNTRQFLINLKQDGKVLPEGPVIISPDGLFPSLYREVIRRAPHEFKISCLMDIKVLFPPDHNPFYAGFGNRDTDEVSYLKVGIPIGKIFIINPKGQIAVNRRVDTKSYTCLHALVHGMFPPTPVTEQAVVGRALFMLHIIIHVGFPSAVFDMNELMKGDRFERFSSRFGHCT